MKMPTEHLIHTIGSPVEDTGLHEEHQETDEAQDNRGSH